MAQNNFFEYPYSEFRDGVEQDFTDNVRVKKKVFYKNIGIIAAGIVCMLLFVLRLPSIFLWLGIILLIIGSVLFKNTSKHDEHLLEIYAGERKMELIYYTNSYRFKRVLNVAYEDILRAEFANNSYEKFRLCFKTSEDTNLSSFTLDNKKLDEPLENILEFDLAPNSLEQGFFLYLASSCFVIRNYNRKKIEKKFGTAEDYFENIGADFFSPGE